MTTERTDRELLELAAKAAGIEGAWSDYQQGICYSPRGSLDMHVWRPLSDDGDALRLAFKLRISLSFTYTDRVGDVYAQPPIMRQIFEPVNGDIGAATRRAVVRAAAAIAEGDPNASD